MNIGDRGMPIEVGVNVLVPVALHPHIGGPSVDDEAMSAGGDSNTYDENIDAKMIAQSDHSSRNSHREKGSETRPALVAKGAPMRGTYRIPKGQASVESEWRKLWDMPCCIAYPARNMKRCSETQRQRGERPMSEDTSLLRVGNTVFFHQTRECIKEESLSKACTPRSYRRQLLSCRHPR